jgi:hypothetical protein
MSLWKNRPKCSPKPFLSKFMLKLIHGILYKPKYVWDTSVILEWLPKVNNDPIWSPCLVAANALLSRRLSLTAPTLSSRKSFLGSNDYFLTGWFLADVSCIDRHCICQTSRICAPLSVQIIACALNKLVHQKSHLGQFVRPWKAKYFMLIWYILSYFVCSTKDNLLRWMRWLRRQRAVLKTDFWAYGKVRS